MKSQLEKVSSLIQSEVNVKEIEYLSENSEILVRKAKPIFSSLGKRAGAQMGEVKKAVEALSGAQIRGLETTGKLDLNLPNGMFQVSAEEIEIVNQDIPGWSVATNGKMTVALDITLSDELISEGIAREFVNRIQNLRKDSGFEVTDKISVKLSSNENWDKAVKEFLNYICSEVLAQSLEIVKDLKDGSEVEVNGSTGNILIVKNNV